MARKSVALWILLALTSAGRATPLFPDVKEFQWARDAVAKLTASGLLEGYRDGTFKGDRAITRWELALLVARWLALLEQRQGTFASKTELEEVRKLALALQDELGALGVRVNRLEEEASEGGRLDSRVKDLERITFYGYLTFRGGFQDFRNDGSSRSDPGAPLLDFTSLVGTPTGAGGSVNIGAVGVPLSMNTFGVFPVSDLKSGRIQTSGVALTSRAVLGLRMDLDSDEGLIAGAEFAAFSSQGNSAVDVYYGTQAPYLSNPFSGMITVNGGMAGLSPDNHCPMTRMTLDHFWVRHQPSNTQLRVGAFDDTTFDSMIYVPQLNPSGASDATLYLNSFGFQFKGNRIPINDDVYLACEVMGTRLADRNVGVNGDAYFNHAEGATLGAYFNEDRGSVRLNLLHATNDASAGGPRTVGLVSVVNQQLINPWVNPNGFFLNQLGVNSQTAGVGSLDDKRPVPMPALGNDGFTGVPGQSNVGNIGPQDQTSYGLSSRYEFDQWIRPRLAVDWGHSIYKPQKNSAYSTSGDALRLEVGAIIPTWLRNSGGDPESAGDYFSLGLQAEYLSVDARYDPFILQIPCLVGVFNNVYRFPDFNYSGDLYSLHDTRVYPQNRQGIRLKADWEFGEGGRASLRYANLNQKQTSLQDVRFSANSLGNSPNSDVLGHSPGFMEPVFGAFAPSTFAAAGNNLLAIPLENPRGNVQSFGLDVLQTWRWDQGRALEIMGHFDHSRFSRTSNLRGLVPGAAGVIGENINHVDLNYRSWGLQASYDFDESIGVSVGYDQMRMGGHYDPFGAYSAFAVSSGDSQVRNLDLVQHQPHLGLKWKLDPSTTWDFDLRFLSTRDLVASNVIPNPTLPALNVVGAPQSSIHPFNWSGYRFSSGMTVKF